MDEHTVDVCDDNGIYYKEVSSPRDYTLCARNTASETIVPNTGTRKKPFPAFTGRTGGAVQQQGYSQSLDYESVPINRLDRRPQTTSGRSTHSSRGISAPLYMDPENEHNPNNQCACSMLSMIVSRDFEVTSRKFLELSRSPSTCTTLRRSGCIPFFVQMIHSDSDEVSRRNAAQALHNVVNCHPDDKVGRRESKVLKLIETVMSYCDYLKADLHKSLGIASLSSGPIVDASADDYPPSPMSPSGTAAAGGDRHPSQAIFSLMKISFDEEHRHAMCQLGALPAIAHLVYLDRRVHGMQQSKDSRCISLRRYAGMALINLTFGDGKNKALLCSNKEFMRALVAQLNCTDDKLVHVTASLLRNLSWRADNNMITVLNEIGTVTALTQAAMRSKNMENTLKAILSALWNLSAHCSANKAEFCRVEGGLAFLVNMLTYEAPSKMLTIVENAGGILNNVSSHIAVCEYYREILRARDCLGILLQQLRSKSLTIVSNACGTLWNLSARCATDQKYLWENGAVPMLQNLIHSKHKMISNGSNAALKNLLNYRPDCIDQVPVDSVTRVMKELPSLRIRKQRVLEDELEGKLSETCEIMTVTTSPKRHVDETGGREIEDGKDVIEDLQGKATEDDREELSAELGDAPPSSLGVRPKQEVEQMDQITDYSLRYRENRPQEEGRDKVAVVGEGSGGDENEEIDQFNGNEIILTLEDTVKCYEDEGTPYTISNATSMTDLRRESVERRVKVMMPRERQATEQTTTSAAFGLASGLQTPEKPFKYADEGTPGCFSAEFSRIGSMSSLDGEGEEEKVEKKEMRQMGCLNGANDNGKNKEGPVEVKIIDNQLSQPTIPSLRQDKESNFNTFKVKTEVAATTSNGTNVSVGVTPKTVSFIDYAQETPLMFSRTSSLESLCSAGPACADDVGSVVSEFSRVASGIVSPSELPDSPTQSMPQSPLRGRRRVGEIAGDPEVNQVDQVPQMRGQPGDTEILQASSVFEDNLGMFHVENTPAQFSTATSLSNLSILNDDPVTERKERGTEEEEPQSAIVENEKEVPVSVTENKVDGDFSDNDTDEEEGDDALLEMFVSMGLERRQRGEMNADFVRHYTEDNPAHLSKSCSNSDLSALSMVLDNANQCEVVHDNDDEEEEQRTMDSQPNQSQQPEAVSTTGVSRRDSLSSLSVDSQENDAILEEAIAAGLNRIPAQSGFIVGAAVSNREAPAGVTNTDPDSMSSLESCESMEQSNLLLEQCIQMGLENRSATVSNIPPPVQRSQKPRSTSQGTSGRTSSSSKSHPRGPAPARNVEYHRTDDAALFMELVNMGIEKNAAKGRQTQVQPMSYHQNQHSRVAPSRYDQRENYNSENILARQKQDVLRRIDRMAVEEKFGGDAIGGGRSTSSKREWCVCGYAGELCRCGARYYTGTGRGGSAAAIEAARRQWRSGSGVSAEQQPEIPRRTHRRTKRTPEERTGRGGVGEPGGGGNQQHYKWI